MSPVCFAFSQTDHQLTHPMHIPLLFLLLVFTPAMPALADTITVTAPWTQVRRSPSPDSRAIDLVYGNDAFEVLEAQGGWVKIRTARGVTGWIPSNAGDMGAGPPPPERSATPGKPVERKAGTAPAAPTAGNLRATALSNGISLRQLGFREQARAKFTELMLDAPGSSEAYEAARQMLSYYLVGYLPPLQQGQVTAEGQAEIARVSRAVLLQEAVALQGEKRFAEASRVYRFLLDADASNGRAFLGLLDALQGAMAEALRQKKEQELDQHVTLFRQYFPAVPLPDDVQNRLAPSGKR
jgi:hypothetical protein